MRVEVIPALAEQQAVLANLLELYAHDFSEFHPVQIGEDGRFGYASLPLYWSQEGRHPFLVRVDGKLAGFVLVKKVDAVWDMAEFFVVRGARRSGVGTPVAHEVWRRFPGAWVVRVMEANVSAERFWSQAVASFTGKAVQAAHRGGWFVFSFDA